MNPGANCERNVVTVDTDASVLRAAAIMRRHHLRYLVVIKSRYGGWIPTGIITEHDIASEVVGQGLDPRHVTVGTAISGKQNGLRADAGCDNPARASGALTMDEMLALLVMELNRIGQPIQHIQLTQTRKLSAPGSVEN